jgi:hypothetical protein
MKIRIGGPLPLRFELNWPMFAGTLLGLVGVLLAGLILLGLVPGGVTWDTPCLGERLRCGDLAIGISLLGMALYFVGRIVQLYDHLRRRK